MKRLIAISSILLILAATVWYFCLYASPLVISPETTYITAPLMSDGKRIDYFRAWEERAYPPEMKTDNNGYRILVRAIGDPELYTVFGTSIFADKRELDPELFRLQVYEKLGLDPTVPPTLKLESVDTFMLRYRKEHQIEDGSDWWRSFYRPWTFENLPMLGEWLDENNAGIDLLGEAVRKPVFFAPSVRDDEQESRVFIGGLQAFREFARALSARAYYRIGIGDIDGAVDDVITCYLLARHAGKQGTLVNYLVGIALEGMAGSIHIGANPEAPPSREQLQRLFDAIRSLPPSQRLENCWEAERLFALAFLQEYAFGRKLDVYGMPQPGLWSFAVDWNSNFRAMNEMFDSVIAGKDPEETVMGWEEAMKFLAWMAGRIDRPPVRLTVRGRTKVVFGVLVSSFAPAVQPAREAERRRQCAENMKLLTLALLLYEKDHGTLPDSDWRVAVKPYLGENAERYFRCPSSSAAEDETTYAMIRRESGVMPTTPYTFLLVEVYPPMKMSGNDGTIPESMARINKTEGLSSEHPGIFNVSYRSGAVAAMSSTMSAGKLQSHIDGTAEVP
jgi:hypothetical protein